MKWILVLAFLSGFAWAQSSKGNYDGILVRVETARISTNGKLVVVTAKNTQSAASFVLVCVRAEGHCALPRADAIYQVVSQTEKGIESWGLAPVEGNEKLSIFYLVYAGKQ